MRKVADEERSPRPHPLRHRAQRCRVGRGSASAGPSPRPGDVRGPRPHLRHRRTAHPEHPRDQRRRDIRRPAFPFRRSGTTMSTSQARRSPSSAPVPAPSSSCRRSRRKSVSSMSFSARHPGCAQAQPRHQGPQAVVHRQLPGGTRLYRNAATGSTRRAHRVHRSRCKRSPVTEKSRPAYIARGRGSRAAEQAHPDYRLGCKRVLQSNNYTRSSTRQRRAQHRRRRGDPSPTASSTATACCTRPTSSSTARASTSSTPSTTSLHRPGRPRPRRLFREGGSRDLSGHHGLRLPEPLLHAGPNTALGHNSVVFMIQQQTKSSSLLDEMDGRRARSSRPRRRRPEFNTTSSGASGRASGLQGGCTSWYLDRQGKHRTIWPKFTFQYWWETRKVDQRAHLAWEQAA